MIICLLLSISSLLPLVLLCGKKTSPPTKTVTKTPLSRPTATPTSRTVTPTKSAEQEPSSNNLKAKTPRSEPKSPASAEKSNDKANHDKALKILGSCGKEGQKPEDCNLMVKAENYILKETTEAKAIGILELKVVGSRLKKEVEAMKECIGGFKELQKRNLHSCLKDPGRKGKYEEFWKKEESRLVELEKLSAEFEKIDQKAPTANEKIGKIRDEFKKWAEMDDKSEPASGYEEVEIPKTDMDSIRGKKGMSMNNMKSSKAKKGESTKVKKAAVAPVNPPAANEEYVLAESIKPALEKESPEKNPVVAAN